MHSQKTKQPYIGSAKKNGTRKKKSAVKEEHHSREKGLNTSLRKTNQYIKKQRCKLLRTESLNTGRPKNKPKLKKLNSEWIQAQQTVENRTSKERAVWKTAQQKTQKTNKQKTRKRRTQKTERSRKTPQREENKREKKKPLEEKVATRNMKMGRMTLKRSLWRNV